MKSVSQLVLSCLAAGLRRPGAAIKVSFRLNWYLGGAHAPFQLGLGRGYYQRRGHRPDHQRGTRLRQHGAGRRRRHRYILASLTPRRVMRLASKDAPITHHHDDAQHASRSA